MKRIINKKLAISKNLFAFLIVLLVLQPFTTNAQYGNALGLTDDRKAQTLTTVPSSVTTSYTCLSDGTGMYETIEVLTGLQDAAVDAFGAEVTAEEENQFGDDYYEYMKESGEWTFIESGNMLNALTNMMNDLLKCRREATELEYTMHLIDSDVINAFTAGGHVYVTTGIIDFCETTSEIASIIAHEIGHNEKGHITKRLSKLKAGRAVAGDFGDIAVAIEQVLTPAFNQQNEVQVDCYGADLIKAAGYSVCRSVEVWKRMAEEEGDYNQLMNIFRTHPYSSVRRDCLREHIDTNYNTTCN